MAARQQQNLSMAKLKKKHNFVRMCEFHGAYSLHLMYLSL